MSEENQQQEEVVQEAKPVPAYASFELVKERALMVHLNTRTEMHGDEPKPACDLKFEFSAPNSILKKIREGLVESFYEADRQSDIEGDFLRKLKHPQLGPVTYDWEIPRVRLEIHDPVSDFDNVVMAGGKANKFKLTMMDGGTVKVQFRVQFSDFDEEVAPSLIRCQKQNVTISLASAGEEAKPDNFEQAELLGSAPDKMSEARKKAEAAFGKTDPTDEIPQSVIDHLSTPESNVTSLPKGRKRVANGAEAE